MWRIKLNIRHTVNRDLFQVLEIHRRAFGAEKGIEIAELVDGLFEDPTARPFVSLLALDGDTPVGHVLFTKARLTGPDAPTPISLLAPLAVIPEHQAQGVGGRLIEAGLECLAEAGVVLVFVLGHPTYYPRHGFRTAGVLGFGAPYPIPEEYADAWMVQELKSGILGRVTGQVICSDVLHQPQHWRE